MPRSIESFIVSGAVGWLFKLIERKKTRRPGGHNRTAIYAVYHRIEWTITTNKTRPETSCRLKPT